MILQLYDSTMLFTASGLQTTHSEQGLTGLIWIAPTARELQHTLQ